MVSVGRYLDVVEADLAMFLFSIAMSIYLEVNVRSFLHQHFIDFCTFIYVSFNANIAVYTIVASTSLSSEQRTQMTSLVYSYYPCRQHVCLVELGGILSVKFFQFLCRVLDLIERI